MFTSNKISTCNSIALIYLVSNECTTQVCIYKKKNMTKSDMCVYLVSTIRYRAAVAIIRLVIDFIDCTKASNTISLISQRMVEFCFVSRHYLYVMFYIC